MSGHKNHIATFEGTRELVRSKPNSAPIKLYSLVSHSVLRKYAGMFNFVLLLFGQRDLALVAAPRHTRAAREAMRRHASQYVWFRQLYVMFSSYLFVNVLEEVK